MENLCLPSKKFHIIYADPPWEYKDKKKSGRTRCGAENYYPAMSLEEIKGLPVSEITEENAVLYLWTTWPMIFEAGDVIEAWGFKYVTLGFIWIKTNKDGSPWFGVGAYSKSNTEPCLFAAKGNVGRLVKNEQGRQILTDSKEKLSVKSNHVSQLVFEKRKRHSEKPDEVRRRIVSLWGDISRIELFARTKMPGWYAWGDEIIN